MRIGFDARMIDWSGIGTYSKNLLSALAKIDTEDEFMLFCRRGTEEAVPSASNITRLIVDTPVFSLAGQRYWSRLLKQQKLDVFHSPHFIWPLVKPGPAVATIHDLTPLLFPEVMPSFFKRTVYRSMTRSAVKEADRIIAVSSSTRDDLVKLMNTAPAKIKVIYEAADEKYRPVKDEALLARTKSKYGIEGKYLLNIGNQKPHKNWNGLIKAFAGLRPDLKLVLIGAGGEVSTRLSRSIEELGIRDRVLFPGFIPVEDMTSIYSAAEALVFPSLYEGFGLPVLEAMACGTPVICSEVSSLPEVAGDAALLVRPTDLPGLTEAIRRVIEDPALREEIVKRGLERAKEFSWEKAARETLVIYHEVIGGA